MRRNRKILLSLAAVVVASAVVYVCLLEYQHRIDPVEISKHRSIIESLFETYPDTRLDIFSKGYLASNGTLYAVTEPWNIGRKWFVASYGGAERAPFDGEDHFCWVVQWRAPYKEGIKNSIWVFVDRDTLEVLSVWKDIDT
ncbi:hypothetical protein GTO27_02670 [Candidatus Bathyarchaeota archaeon]|nr:hypothetical protein [Candidatus Bathyarchaeota archaeon]